ncbi:MAG: hypothetical protein PHY48_15395 [Candidatus Cloacimonetes bacterium]|nr:hypothetical protein [Candidatus Cloacimonadota bacterium]
MENQTNAIVEVVAKEGLLTKDNGITALAVIGAGTVVFGAVKGAKWLMAKFGAAQAPVAIEAPVVVVAPVEAK